MRSLKTLKIMAYLPKSWVVLSLQVYDVLLGPQNRFSPLFMAFWWIAKSFCRRKLQQHLLQLCKSALRCYIFLVGLLASRQFTGLVKSVNGFSDTEILFIYLWDTHYILVPLWPIFHSQCTAFKTNNSWKKHEVSA